MEYFVQYGYIGIFLVSFLVTTLLPFGRKLIFSAFLLAGTSSFVPFMKFRSIGIFLADKMDAFKEYLIEYGAVGVFIASFLAATVLPFSSEIVLTGVLLAGGAYWPCMIAATLGNFLGGMSCYWLGMVGKVEWIEKYLKMDKAKIDRVQNWIKDKGSWTAFFVFLPGIGDFIAVALGFLRANIWIVAISMFAGKAIRYWVWMEFVYKVQEFL